jgi:D-aminopeptidase
MIGTLVVTNTGAAGDLRIDGRRLEEAPTEAPPQPGSIMMIVGTNAPLEARQLGRLARRAPLGLARAGGLAAHGSGDFVIAFSSAPCAPDAGMPFDAAEEAAAMTDCFRATVEATEEAIVNSVVRATPMEGQGGHRRPAIPLGQVRLLSEARFRPPV